MKNGKSSFILFIDSNASPSYVGLSNEKRVPARLLKRNNRKLAKYIPGVTKEMGFAKKPLEEIRDYLIQLNQQ